MSNRLFEILLLGIIFLSFRCTSKHPTPTLFTLLPPKHTGVDFINKLTITETNNPYIFKNFLNGGGVAAGDINNDGLCDLYFAGNMVSNKLYLNKGNLKFEDITSSSGTGTEKVWSTGVSMADVNGDGWLDIYVCKSGSPEAENRHNALYLNSGNLTFREVSQQAGLDNLGLSTHAVFFDFDKDGDLDCYLLNNSIRSVGSYDLVKDSRLQHDTMGGNKLYQNNLIQIVNGELLLDTFAHFVDITKNSGIYSSAIGFGLGVTVADLNNDHWPDLYVSNDYFERDYMYINQKDGRFIDVLPLSTTEISMGSMGADIADLNEDGWPEIFVTEMLPSDPVRYKTKIVFDHWTKYTESLSQGYHRQFGRNVLQLHRGVGNDSIPYFSEIGRIKGVEATEWSWGALLADFNNDGLKDIFVANGIYKDLIDLDFVNFYFNPESVRALIKSKKQVITTMFEAAESVPMPNYLFLQDSDFQFRQSSISAGLGIPTFSNGSAYGDLDNDGDLELIINNVNMPAMIFENHASQMEKHFIRIHLEGSGGNTNAIGSKVIVYACGRLHHLELNPMRGFQSSVDPVLTIGLGNCELIDSIVINWPSGQRSLLSDVKVDSTLLLREINTTHMTTSVANSSPLLVKQNLMLPYHHIENAYSDFDRDRLMFYMISNEGPKAAVLDLDKDGMEDIVFSGSRGQKSVILFQEREANFASYTPPDIAMDSLSEGTDILLEDFNCDGLPDIYIASGSSELPSSSSAMRDHLYLNSGNRNFSIDEKFYKSAYESHHAICLADFDHDKDPDLVTFSRISPFSYGVPPKHHLYLNDHCKSFTESYEDFFTHGMVTSAETADIDSDGDDDIIAAYEYGPVCIFLNDRGLFKNATKRFKIDTILGLWHHVSVVDIDNDGDLDLVGGNHGLNSRLKADPLHPLVLYVNDFDRNGQTEQILCWRRNGSDYPIALKDDLFRQLPYLNKKYLTYSAFANASMQDMFDADQISQSLVYIVNELRTGIFYNQGDRFQFIPLPEEAQLTIQYASWTGDINNDQRMDIILGGNQFSAKPEMGTYAASYGTVFLQQEEGRFQSMPFQLSGFFEHGSIRDIQTLYIGEKPNLLIVKNNDAPSVYAMPYFTKNKIKRPYQ